jgi:hypothetical protein
MTSKEKKEYLQQYYLANKEELLRKRREAYKLKKDYYNANRRDHRRNNEEFRKKDLESSRQWREDNKKAYLAYLKQWRQDNKDIVNYHGAVKRSRKRKAMPSWLTEDQLWMIKEIYSLARLRTQMTGIEWHVDHMIPLKGKTVCGLHVPWNLQVIPGLDNLKKNNKLEYDIV